MVRYAICAAPLFSAKSQAVVRKPVAKPAQVWYNKTTSI